MSGADYTEYDAGKFATDVFIKGGSANPFIFKGTVTTATSNVIFASTDLDGHGDDTFVDWYVFVFYDTAGTAAAPQGEWQPISDYVSATGTFTHTAFTAQLAVGDEVFIVQPTIFDQNLTMDQIFALVSAQQVLTETGGVVTTDGTEQDLFIINAPAGVFQPEMILLDFTNQTATEILVVREYYRIAAGGGFIMADEVTFTGVQDPLLKLISLAPNRYGIRITIELTAGTNRAYAYEAVYKE
ncbi:hypothetical protein E4H12_09535 [Candidatus Thorarchaeota archaeon]|nr:MAG: hypothetical protein E4H12_09535 [Candidatus Thorarchaeota archaeon]